MYGKREKRFFKGYLVHLLTDKFWLDTLYIDVYLKNYNEDKSPLQDVRWAYYNDTDRLDFMLYEKIPEREIIWQKLKDAKVFGIENKIRSENVYLWRQRTLNWFNGECNHKNPIKYIKYEDIIRFISFASEKIGNILKEKLIDKAV